jgi:hypothetical protein
MQRRDRKGRFAEMGGGFSFSFKLPSGGTDKVSGRVVGMSGEDDVELEVVGHSSIPDGIYALPASKGETVKAILSLDAVEGLPENKAIVDSSLAVDIGEPMSQPSGWTPLEVPEGAPKEWESPEGLISRQYADGYVLYRSGESAFDTEEIARGDSWADILQKADSYKEETAIDSVSEKATTEPDAPALDIEIKDESMPKVEYSSISRAPDGFKRGSGAINSKPSEQIPAAGVAFSDVDGFLEQRQVQVGNRVTSADGSARFIADQDTASLHLFEGGKLSDIPDQFLVNAIIKNSSEGDENNAPNADGSPPRFTTIGSGGGVNGMLRLKDESTGALIGLKYADGTDTLSRGDAGGTGYRETANEIVSELVSEHMGYEPVPMRVVPVTATTETSYGTTLTYTKGVALISELIHNRRGGSIESGRLDERGDGKSYEYGADIESGLRMAILDIIIANRDRHEGNFLLERSEDGQSQYVPIDHSLSLDRGVPKRVADGQSPLLHLEFERALHAAIKKDGRESVEKTVAKIMEQLKDVNTDTLSSQIAQLASHFSLYQINLTEKDKKDFNNAVDRMRLITSSQPQEVFDVIYPDWKFEYYDSLTEGMGQPIIDLGKVRQFDKADGGKVDL